MSVESNVVSYANDLNAKTAADSADRIAHIKLSHCVLPLATPVSDAKVLTGRQKPMTEIAFIFCEIQTQSGASGIGFGYSKPMRKKSLPQRLAKMRMTSPNSGPNSCGQARAWAAAA
jgi:hypothetical protein